MLVISCSRENRSREAGGGKIKELAVGHLTGLQHTHLITILAPFHPLANPFLRIPILVTDGSVNEISCLQLLSTRLDDSHLRLLKLDTPP